MKKLSGFLSLSSFIFAGFGVFSFLFGENPVQTERFVNPKHFSSPQESRKNVIESLPSENTRIFRNESGEVQTAQVRNSIFNVNVGFLGKTSLGVPVWNFSMRSNSLGSIEGQLTPNQFEGIADGQPLSLSIYHDKAGSISLKDMRSGTVYTYTENDITVFSTTGAFPSVISNARKNSPVQILLVTTQEELDAQLQQNQALVVGTIAVAAKAIE